MKNHILFATVTSSLAFVVAAGLTGCGGDDTGTPSTTADASTDHSVSDGATGDGGLGDTGSGGDTGGGGDTGLASETGTGNEAGSEAGPVGPAAPTLGTQIDRFGRPAINTALNNTFNSNVAAQGAAKDAYNADNVPANWGTNYAAQIKQNLAIYDGLDTICGNQVAYQALANPDYQTLAGVLANDRLWLNTGSTTCNTYLAVELATLNLMAPTDCGGRTLTENVIDFTYNSLAGTTTATNGITAPASAPSTTFPYLAAPH